MHKLSELDRVIFLLIKIDIFLNWYIKPSYDKMYITDVNKPDMVHKTWNQYMKLGPGQST